MSLNELEFSNSPQVYYTPWYSLSSQNACSLELVMTGKKTVCRTIFRQHHKPFSSLELFSDEPRFLVHGYLVQGNFPFSVYPQWIRGECSAPGCLGMVLVNYF